MIRRCLSVNASHAPHANFDCSYHPLLMRATQSNRGRKRCKISKNLDQSPPQWIFSSLELKRASLQHRTRCLLDEGGDGSVFFRDSLNIIIQGFNPEVTCVPWLYIAFISEDLGSPLCKDSQQEEGGICAVRPLQGLGGCASADLVLEKKRNIRAIRHIPTLTPSHPQPHIISLQLVWNPTGSNWSSVMMQISKDRKWFKINV